MTLIISCIVAFLITLLLAIGIIPFANRIGWVDQPSVRKQHDGAIPLIGGVAIFSGFAFALLTLGISLQPQRALLAGAFLLMIIGTLDDFRELSTKFRFAAQIISSLLMAFWGGVILYNLGWLFTADAVLLLGIISIPFTVFATVGVINALNMSDGMDGLAGGLAFIAASAMCFIAWQVRDYNNSQILAVLSCAIFAFWLLNMRFPWQRRARIFMGDAGSMLLGFIIAWYAIVLSQGDSKAMPPVIALWLFAMPLLDTIYVMLNRLTSGKSPFLADREHLHHMLIRFGLSVSTSVMIILGVAIIFATTGILGLLYNVPDHYMFVSFSGVLVAYFFAVKIGWNKITLKESNAANKTVLKRIA